MKKILFLMLTIIGMVVPFSSCSSDEDSYNPRASFRQDSINVVHKLLGTWVQDSARWTSYAGGYTEWRYDEKTADTLAFRPDGTVTTKEYQLPDYTSNWTYSKYAPGALTIGNYKKYFVKSISERKMFLNSYDGEFQYIYRKL